jgi:hypothetical protein
MPGVPRLSGSPSAACAASDVRGVIIDRRRRLGREQAAVHKSVYNHMQKALSLFEKGPLALVAGGGI